MGIPGKLDDPKVLDAYRRTAAACRKYGRALGIGGIKEGPVLEEIVAMGGNFIMGRVDGALLAAGRDRRGEGAPGDRG